ncbi:hypothetical protein HNQ36_005097 [Afipia massiliensis]|uniref:Uncharacterized protein n=1 Tax=Afipia massiliensis TaxID=211460 RepID=A0A840NEH9_9BRAD|nr:hypothetical protein [Afipia massiliensis]
MLSTIKMSSALAPSGSRFPASLYFKGHLRATKRMRNRPLGLAPQR